MCILTELADLGAPPMVMQAAERVAACQQAQVRPSADLVSYIAGWVSRQQGQNRYGK